LFGEPPPPAPAIVNAPPQGENAEYGKYVATFGECRGCHGSDMTGSPATSVSAAIVNPRPFVSSLTLEEFIQTMRTGVRPHGRRNIVAIVRFHLNADCLIHIEPARRKPHVCSRTRHESVTWTSPSNRFSPPTSPNRRSRGTRRPNSWRCSASACRRRAPGFARPTRGVTVVPGHVRTLRGGGRD